MNWFRQIHDLWTQMGAARFVLFFGLLSSATVAYVMFGMWASDRIGWPEAYGFRCQGRGCVFIQMAQSYKLLQSPTLDELIVFAWLWAIIGPAIIAAVIIVIRRKWKRHSQRIRPLRPN